MVDELAGFSGFELKQNYPNPFNTNTIIDYRLPEGRHQASLKLYDISGKEIANLVNEEKTSGSYQVNLNANGLLSGVYYYRLSAGNQSLTRKLLLTK